MASIRDAVDECIRERNSLLKFFVFAIPLFLCTQAILSGMKPDSGMLLIGCILTSVLLLGYMIKITLNVADESSTIVLPNLNIIVIFLIGLKGALVLAPVALISKILGALCIGLLANAPLPPQLTVVFSWIIGIIFGSFVYTSYLMYTRRGKVFDAFNVSAIFKYCVDILIAVFFMKILIAIIDIILILPIGYLLWLFLGIQNPVSIMFLCCVVVFNISLMGHYFAQIGYEIIAVDEEEKAEDLKYAQMEKERLEKLKNNNFE